MDEHIVDTMEIEESRPATRGLYTNLYDKLFRPEDGESIEFNSESQMDSATSHTHTSNNEDGDTNSEATPVSSNRNAEVSPSMTRESKDPAERSGDIADAFDDLTLSPLTPSPGVNYRPVRDATGNHNGPTVSLTTNCITSRSKKIVEATLASSTVMYRETLRSGDTTSRATGSKSRSLTVPVAPKFRGSSSKPTPTCKVEKKGIESSLRSNAGSGLMSGGLRRPTGSFRTRVDSCKSGGLTVPVGPNLRHGPSKPTPTVEKKEKAWSLRSGASQASPVKKLCGKTRPVGPNFVHREPKRPKLEPTPYKPLALSTQGFTMGLRGGDGGSRVRSNSPRKLTKPVAPKLHTSAYRASPRTKATPDISEEIDSRDMKKQFRARPMPNFNSIGQKTVTPSKVLSSQTAETKTNPFSTPASKRLSPENKSLPRFAQGTASSSGKSRRARIRRTQPRPPVVSTSTHSDARLPIVTPAKFVALKLPKSTYTPPQPVVSKAARTEPVTLEVLRRPSINLDVQKERHERADKISKEKAEMQSRMQTRRHEEALNDQRKRYQKRPSVPPIRLESIDRHSQFEQEWGRQLLKQEEQARREAEFKARPMPDFGTGGASKKIETQKSLSLSDNEFHNSADSFYSATGAD